MGASGSRGMALWQNMSLLALYRYRWPQVGQCQNADHFPPFVFNRNQSRSASGISSQFALQA
eukprot:7881568-Prorocentrum_lima.AAC.1